MKVHLIAIGGSAMHNMAIALSKKGYDVSGSDDAIYEPSKSRLQKFNLLPKKIGWFPEKINKNVDCVVIGMHAKKDNPELLKSLKLQIPIFSYPEYIYEQSKNKIRIVIGGSHGKTTITSMILHVLQKLNINCDFMVGAQLKGFDTMVNISDNAKYIVLEGDEYLSSPIDKRPKFHLYKPHIAVISGIAWDHINVFPTFENYTEQFRIFKNMIKDTLIYCQSDETVNNLVTKETTNCQTIPYKTPNYKIIDGETFIDSYKINIFGKHNLQNLNAARLVCNQLKVSNQDFFHAIASFSGADNRLEIIKKTKYSIILKDFAHSPSKLKASINAVKEQFPNRQLIACMELHTYSSLNKDYISQYENSMKIAETAIIFYDTQTIKHKNMTLISKKLIVKSFNREDLIIFNNTEELKQYLYSINFKNTNLLMMSSGSFGGLNLLDL
ncbi:MAG: peptidoglycan synthetase [Flavobacteriales bacterium]|nr:peptidoglycan synthetase [Flavobacteriales bacterium]